MNFSELIDSRVSPVDCHKLQLLGAYCTISLVLGVVFNSLWILIFVRYKEVRTTMNYFVFTNTILNLFGCLLEYPFIIPSCFACRWLFKETGCIISGFIMYFVGCAGIYLMTAISIERYYVIYKPMGIKQITLRLKVALISACLMLGLLWPMLPLFGWSRYTFDASQVSCSVEWIEKSLNVVSYNVTIWIMVFLIPLVIMAFTNFRLIWIVSSQSNKFYIILTNIVVLDQTTAHIQQHEKYEKKKET